MSNSDNIQNSSQYPFTNTDMFVGLLANSDKLQPEDKRYQYNGEKNPELDDDHANYISEKNNNSERHTENITDTRNSETKNTDTRNTDTRNTDTRNTDTRNTETYNNTQTEKKDDSTAKKDDDENLTPEELMLRKLDMLRKLSELAQAGVKLSQNYNMNSDYKMMKYEYELHKGIRAKQNGINWMSSMSLNLIYGVEMLNEKYNPFDLKLKGWSEQMNADVNNYYDVFGELYEKYNQPGKNMAPELKLLLMVSGSALKFHLTNTMMSNLPTLNTQLDEDPVLAEQLRQKAIAQKIKEQSVKNNEALKQAMNKQHEEATQKAHDLNLIRQKEMELQNLKRENAQKNAELEAYKEKLLMSQTQANTNLNKSVANNTNNIQQKPVQTVQQIPTPFPIPQPTNLNQNNIPQQQIKAPPAVQRMMMARQNQQNNQVNFEDQMRQQYGLNNSTVVTNKLDNLQAQANYMEELEKLKLLRIQKERELEEEKRKTLLKQQIKKETESSSETSESSRKSSSTSESSKTSKSSVEFNINLKTILSDSKNKMLDITSSDKIKNLGVVSKDEISKSNISLGKKRVKKDKESKDSKDSKESKESKETRETKESLKSDKQKVVRQKKTGISLV